MKSVTKPLQHTVTEQNLKAAFAGECQAMRRYLAFADQAEQEGHHKIATIFRDTADGERGHSGEHLSWLELAGDPATGLPIGNTVDNLRAAIAGETYEYTDMYPGMARQAREEGFEDIALWFETLAAAERVHAGRFNRALGYIAPDAADPTLNNEELIEEEQI